MEEKLKTVEETSVTEEKSSEMNLLSSFTSMLESIHFTVVQERVTVSPVVTLKVRFAKFALVHRKKWVLYTSTQKIMWAPLKCI